MMRDTHGKTPLVLVAAGALVLLALVGATPAGAVEVHLFDSVLSLEGDCNGDDGVLDPDCAGTPPAYPVGDAPKPFAAPCGTVTDSHGDIYVANPAVQTSGGRIDVFDPAGHFLLEIPDEWAPCQIAVDSEGHLYVTRAKSLREFIGGATYETFYVVRYDPSSYPPDEETTFGLGATFEFTALGGESVCKQVNSVAVDPSNDHLYIGHACNIEEYGSAAEGTPLNPLVDSSIAETSQFGESWQGIDVYGGSHDVFVARRSTSEIPPRILIFDGADGHKKCELDGTETPSGEFDFGIGGAVAIDQSNGDLYVYDIDHKAIEQFGPTGAGCPSFIGELPKEPPALNTSSQLVDLAVDAPLTIGEVGYDSPNEGHIYATSGTTANNSHLYAFKPKEGCAPEVKAQDVSGLGETEAVLEAELNPCGLETTYRFEYTTQADFDEHGYQEALAVPLPDADAGEGGGFVSVSEPTAGLAAGTAYRFRLVASNCAAEGADPEACLTIGEGVPGGEGQEGSFSTYPPPPVQTCPNATLRVGAGATLPDCRAFELVTPPDTNGRIPTMGMLGTGFGMIGFDTTLASPDGTSVVFGSNSGSLPELGGGGSLDTYEALRGVEGWRSGFTGLSGAQAQIPRPGGISPSHRYAFWNVEGDVGTLSTGEGSSTYLRVPGGAPGPSPTCAPASEPAGRFEWVGCGSLGFETQAPGKWISGAEHVIFATIVLNGRTARQLEPCAPPTGTGAIYDRIPGGDTKCVSLLPGDITPTTEAQYRGVSADGSVVAFTLQGDDTLYVRVDNAETLEVADGNPTFAGVSANGSRAFYLEGGDAFTPGEIFACDLDEGGCVGEGAHPPIQIGSGDESTLVNVSADGSHVYFVSPLVLSGDEENGWGAKAQPSEENLYVWDGSSVRFIARLAPVDVSGEFIEEAAGTYGGLGLWVSHVLDPTPGTNRGASNDSSRTTPDGAVLVFESRTNLTSYDNEGRREVYRYDAGAAPGSRLLCLSCNPTGAAAVSDAWLESPGPGRPELDPFPPVNSIAHIANVTVDGQRVFFQSGDRLVPHDLDGHQDVYEWEAEGAGGCQRSAGCLSLISGGRSAEDDYLYAMTPDGHDIFFLSADTLNYEDPDGTPSIYDARIGGGFPKSPLPAAECLGEACQPAVAPPDDPTPASSSFEGAGNITGPPKRRCPKGKRKVRRAGKTRCVKRQTKKRPHRKRNRNNHRRAAR